MNEPAEGRQYWRSLDELGDTPEFREFVEREFPNFSGELLTSPSRRRFLKLMGASLAMAGLSGCRWPQEKIAPFGRRPDGRAPGKAVRYATAMELKGAAAGLLVTSYDGRPIKIEGNPDHPVNRGATDAFSQASVLELYDPDRSTAVTEAQGGRTFPRSWDQFAKFAQEHFGALRMTGGAGLAVLAETSSSPSMADMRARFLKAYPRASWHEYEPLSRDNERTGSQQALGRVYRTHLALDRADVIVCLDADPLMSHPASVQYSRDFVAGRDIDKTGKRLDNGRPMSRLYSVESTLSVTGSMADHRLAVPSSDIPAIACRIAAKLVGRGVDMPGDLRSAVLAGADHAAQHDEFVEALVGDLLAERGRSLLVVGDRQPAEIHALVHVLNAALGNSGQTVRYTEEIDPDRPTHTQAIAALAGDLEAGRITTLLVLGGNPVFDAPADLNFGERLDSVETTIHLSLHANETSHRCRWRLPRAHYLESWADARAYDGTVSVVQPLIRPLYAGRTTTEVLALLAGGKTTKAHDVVRRTLEPRSGGTDFETWWRQVLHDGLVKDSAWPAVKTSPRGGPWTATLSELATRPGNTDGHRLEVVYTADSHVYDGRFANNGWLQETPDPLSKLTWDNAAAISPATAKRLDLRRGDVVMLRAGDRELEIAVFVLPGQADDSLAISVGYGRTAAGRVGDGTGFDAYRFRTSAAMDVLNSVEIVRTGRTYLLAGTQDHHAIDTKVGKDSTQERLGMLVREGTVEEYKQHPDFAKHAVHHPPLLSLWEERKYDEGHSWGMTIDLNKCIGCSACAVACQAENNIPIVGKEEVDRGREMNWLRIDRYFKGEPDSPEVAHQPVACQHCENAPCEQVCPVAATVHSDEGLSDVVYNRCIGTRYCANNCPYKVRRFNWFNNHKNLTETEKLSFNPEVTVRERGVIEKCSFCVQRITAVKIEAKNEGRAITDGEIVPACAQACPTRAIEFGDLNDPDSRVARAQAEDRAYAMLGELNVKPRNLYLAKLRNPAAEGPATTNAQKTPAHH